MATHWAMRLDLITERETMPLRYNTLWRRKKVFDISWKRKKDVRKERKWGPKIANKF